MNKFIIALIVATMLLSCKEEKLTNAVEISGNIKGLKKGKLYIQKVQDSTLVVLDSVILNGNSSFKTTIELDAPEMLYLFLDRGVTNSIDNNLLFFAEPGKMTVDTELDLFLAKSKITGSKNQVLYEEYKDIISQFNGQQLDMVKEELMALKGKKIISAEDNKKKQDALLRKRYFYAANFALTHADHEVAPYIVLTDIYDMNLKFLNQIHDKMTPKILASKYGKKMTAYLEERKKEEGVK